MIKQNLPAAHQKVVDDRHNQEVKTLIDIKEQLDEADVTEGNAAGGSTHGYVVY